ncbi:hypothetical protein NEHOM01_0909 [Nematocida homosporus]|uniref:uncharacterized protein n=1 Tax=Nematocida homosporus TaxID=1912981 RepID=UPI00221F0AEB|nr:uncharacterized protein NEHOM01_0909 [Nematocida homosporus]KAI5185550.1 hypothetical protein NEHOM01_0909 [Nematocida homosporus]
MINQKVMSVGRFQIYRLKMFGLYIGLILYCLLLLLQDVRGGCETGMSTQKSLPTSDEMRITLERIGFGFVTTGDDDAYDYIYNCASNSPRVITVTHYNPTQLQEPASDTSPIPSSNLTDPTLRNVPSYVIEYSGLDFHFEMPNYSGPTMINRVLEELRKIATIRVPACCVSYSLLDPKYHWENLRILSRIVNLLDCSELDISFNPGRSKKVHKPQPDRSICLLEAQNAVAHAKYNSVCNIQFSTSKNNSLLKFLDSGIVLLREIASISVEEDEFQSSSRIAELPLQEGYTISFVWLPMQVDLDLSFLHTSPRCDLIIIRFAKAFERITLTGLEKAIARQPTLSLKAGSDVLRYLSKPCQPLIHVHTILGFDAIPSTVQLMRELPQEQTIPEPRIIATQANVFIPTYQPCSYLEYYKDLFSSEAFAQLGISVDWVYLDYRPGRDDLRQTLKFFQNLNVLSEIPVGVRDKHVVCCGDKLDNPWWSIQTPICIQLDHPQLDNEIMLYRSQRYMCFCQYIRYQIISIKGDINPSTDQVLACINLLSLFHNIAAVALEISNVRGQSQDATSFDLHAFQERVDSAPKQHLNAKTVVLDNVDTEILYWILGQYIFAELIEIYVVNQRFANLGIALFLSLPAAQPIGLLVINDFLDLNEVKYYEQPDQFEGFSLFKSADSENPEHDPQSLRKLSLHLEDASFTSHRAIISKLLSYGVLLQHMTFEEYITWETTNPNADPTMLDKKEFALDHITLNDLTSDLNNCLARNAGLSSLSRTPVRKSSVERLFLLFDDPFLLDECHLLTIIRWLACRFTNVKALRISNAIWTQREIDLITSHNYLFAGLELLSSIQLKPSDSDEGPIELLTKPYRLSLVKHVTSPKHALFGLPSKMISQLVAHSNELGNFLSQRIDLNAPLRKVISDLQESGTQISCMICSNSLYVLATQEDRPADREAAHPFDPDQHFTTVCYLKCGHSFCNDCVVRFKENLDNRCSFCRVPIVYSDAHRLISAPLSSFLFTPNNVYSSFIDSEQLRSMTWCDGNVYLYVAYKDTTDIFTKFNEDIIYDRNNPIYVI